MSGFNTPNHPSYILASSIVPSAGIATQSESSASTSDVKTISIAIAALVVIGIIIIVYRQISRRKKGK